MCMNKKVMIFANNDVGLYNFRKELLERLIRDGNQVYCSLPFGEKTSLLSDLGCECIDTKISRHGTNPIEDLKLFFKYLKLLSEVKPDTVLTYTIKPNVYGGLACAFKKIPYIANITGLGTAIENGGLMRKLTLFLYRIGLKKAETVFFQNSANRDFMVSKKIVKVKNELLPGSGVNLETNCYEPYPANDDNVIFLIIGRIMKAKGTDEILEAAKEIKKEHPNVIFRFIGSYDGDYKQKIEEAVDNGTVEYIGVQSDVHSFIKESHATLHASYHEGMSNVLLETAASGRPIIATDVPGCKETYDNGISGIAFKPKDTADLIRAVKEFLLLTHEQKEQMGKAGRLKIEKEFDRNIIVNKYVEIIKKL